MSFSIHITSKFRDDEYGYEEKIVTVFLKLAINGITVKFAPEANFVDFNVDAESEYATDGNFVLAWSPDTILLRSTTFRNEEEEVLSVEVPTTAELMESLRTCLRKWKTVLKE